jgi:hypothetical protein
MARFLCFYILLKATTEEKKDTLGALFLKVTYLTKGGGDGKDFFAVPFPNEINFAFLLPYTKFQGLSFRCFLPKQDIEGRKILVFYFIRKRVHEPIRVSRIREMAIEVELRIKNSPIEGFVNH